MRRSWIMLLAVALTIAVALPAEAAQGGKPGKPTPSPTLFEVTFGFIGDNAGFSSTTGCLESGDTAISMEPGPADRLGTLGGDVPMLEVKLPGLEWYRYYPYYADADAARNATFDPNLYPLDEASRFEGEGGLFGCHGAGIDVTIYREDDGTKVVESIEQYPGLMMLQVGDGTVDFMWHSDYYREFENVGKSKPRYVANDMEDFSYVDNQLAWTGEWDKTTASTGVVTGVMNVTHFSPGAYIPFDGSPIPVQFEMTITPASS